MGHATRLAGSTWILLVVWMPACGWWHEDGLMTPEECVQACQDDLEWQDWLSCAKPNDMCDMMAANAPYCAPNDGYCLCDVLAKTECRWEGDGFKITVPARRFWSIEAVTTYPVKLDAEGAMVGRVCGAPLEAEVGVVPGEPGPGEANGVEVVANFVATNLSKLEARCEGDQDNSIKDGERVDLRRVRAQNGKDGPGSANVRPEHFRLGGVCLEDSGDCSRAPTTAVAATDVRYKNIADRCGTNPSKPEATRINVALVIDNSSSMKGGVDEATLKEEATGHFESPSVFKDHASDWDGARFAAAKDFVASLNPTDRAIAYYYDETGVHVAASDSYICNSLDNAEEDLQPCNRLDGTGVPCLGQGASCDPDPAGAANDTYSAKPFPWQQCHAFGNSAQIRSDFINGIDQKALNSADGRGSLWKAVEQAYTFLKSGGSASSACGGGGGSLGAMHIVVLTDGPDTCVDGDDFSYKDMKTPGLACRPTCASADAKWKDLQIQMAKDGYPVHVHFVQFQAPGYRDPDLRMLEMSCRTDGTYQFINSEDFNKSKPDDFTHAITKAVNRVRNGMSGSWRVAFRLHTPAFAAGQVRRLAAQLLFENNEFDSLTTAVNELDKDSWQMMVGTASSGAEDRRAVLRIPCATDQECGAADNCAAGHCAEGGVCSTLAAPDGRPCSSAAGESGRCRAGACVIGQNCSDAIAKP